MNLIRSDEPATYSTEEKEPVGSEAQHISEQACIDEAMSILEARLGRPGSVISSPEDTWNYLTLRVADTPYEAFGCLWLNNRHGMLGAQEMFRGTIDGATVHCREVVRDAIQRNAAAVIFYHNHPSGSAEPSQADINITRRLIEACNLIDVRVLDHIVIGGVEHVSMAERGLI